LLGLQLPQDAVLVQAALVRFLPEIEAGGERASGAREYDDSAAVGDRVVERGLKRLDQGRAERVEALWAVQPDDHDRIARRA
jgi:hypothetical protein